MNASVSTEQEHPVSYSCCIEQSLGCACERKIGNLGETAERLRDPCPAACLLPSVSPFCCHHTDHISFSKKLFPSSPSFQPFPLFFAEKTYKGNIQKQREFRNISTLIHNHSTQRILYFLQP